MFAVWGCDTHVFYRKDLPLRGFDDDCRRFLARQMEKSDGVNLHPLYNPIEVRKQDNGLLTVVCEMQRGGKKGTTQEFIDFEDVLMATGRHPNIWELGLENA